MHRDGANTGASDLRERDRRFETLKLRNHPLMSHDALASWPPVWSRSGNDGRIGEIGILKQVNSEDSFCKRCFLIIEHEGHRYVGALLFDDPQFCGFVATLLQDHVGRTIKEIGDLEISFAPKTPRRLKKIIRSF